MTFVEFLAGFLGGGFVVAVINAFQTARAERKRKQLEFVRLQLQNLYGPIQFWASYNKQLANLDNKLRDAYKIEYEEKEWSHSPETQKILQEEERKTTVLANQYMHQAIANNERIFDILTNHYSLIDPEDSEFFAQFVVNHTRYKNEINQAGKLSVPGTIYQHLGNIYFIQQDFIKAIDKRFKEKKAELEKILK